MRVLVTGHTGFKGAWLSLMLARAGHEVHGIALEPDPAGIYSRASVGDAMASSTLLDIRDADALRPLIGGLEPELAFHLAAQPLVRRSYQQPRWTVETNVMGTFNVIEALAATDCRGAVIVTTDKVYRNVGRTEGYGEDEPLGGHDPYSASKAAADLLAQSWQASFPQLRLAIARAGNVVGGGDVAEDRLLPDLMRAFAQGREAIVRNPDAVRPWQHVLDCLQGYLDLSAALLDGRGEGAWNLGPEPSSFRTVADAASTAAAAWGPEASWTVEQDPKAVHEAALLTLDASRAREQLGWRERLSFDDAIDWTVAWTRAVAAGGDAAAVTAAQLDRFADLGGAS